MSITVDSERGRLFGRGLDELRAMEPDELGVILLGVLRREWSVSFNDLMATLQATEGRVGEPLGDALSQRLADAWQWLRNEGLLGPSIRHWEREAVTTAGERLPADLLETERTVGWLRHADLDEELAAQVLPIFRRAQYDVAVFAAMRLVEASVRDAARLGNEDIGTRLMDRAFGPTGRLRDPLLDPGEADARQRLFSGAIGVFKNPASHRLASIDSAQQAAEAVLLANALLRTVDHLEQHRSYMDGADAAAEAMMTELAERAVDGGARTDG